MRNLHDAGFTDVLPAHLGVFQYPGPDGQRPGVLALRTSASKQAMNHLLHQLETGGYIIRRSHPGDRRSRVVRLTDRGWEAVAVIEQTMVQLEREWSDAMGQELYDGLAHALMRLESILDQDVRAAR